MSYLAHRPLPSPTRTVEAVERQLRLVLDPRTSNDLHRLAKHIVAVALGAGHVRQSHYDSLLQLHAHQADQIRRLQRRVAELEELTRELPSAS